jgi:hypothetical protein
VRKIEEPRHEADDDKRVGKIEIFRWHGWAPVLFGHKNACACPHSIDLPQRPAALMAKEFYGGSAPRMSNCDAGFFCPLAIPPSCAAGSEAGCSVLNSQIADPMRPSTGYAPHRHLRA